MRKLVILLLALLVWTGCNLLDSPQGKEFKDTGCIGDTRADLMSLLTLKYEEGDLRVVRTNATLNCSIKLGGIACDVSVDDDVIHYRVYERDGAVTNCVCQVLEMTSVVSGLTPGKEYSFYYSCGGTNYAPITFVFEKGFVLMTDASTLVPVWL